MSKLAAQSLRAATSLVTSTRPEMSENETLTAIQTFTKNTVLELKKSNQTEKDELKKLNIQLENYLDNVKKLESLNKYLIAEVEKAKMIAFPFFNTSNLDQNLSFLRSEVEKSANSCVDYEVRIVESEDLIEEIKSKIDFYLNEAAIQKDKIKSLIEELKTFESQRDIILNATMSIQDEIKREKGKFNQSEKELEETRKRLKEKRLDNKKLEFHIQTLLDEISFSKAVFKQQKDDLISKPKSILNPVDLNNFYKSELITAVQQIKQDFKNLGEQQLENYRKQKNNELELFEKVAEYDRVMVNQIKTRIEASKDLEIQSYAELELSSNSSKIEISSLKNRNGELSKKITQLENDLTNLKIRNRDKLNALQEEANKLKLANDNYAGDIDYWYRVTRTKLETEIQTYRSILNCQIKLMRNSNLNYQTNVSSVNSKNSETETINILRRVFDYFDSDKSGTINMSELDKILEKLNIKLSREAYNQMLRDVDRNYSRDIEFNEFCKLMLPVFTGKFEDSELEFAFNKFDLDKSGYITVSELKKILSDIGQKFTDKEIEAMIRTVDSNFDGRLGLNEFKRLMKSTLL